MLSHVSAGSLVAGAGGAPSRQTALGWAGLGAGRGGPGWAVRFVCSAAWWAAGSPGQAVPEDGRCGGPWGSVIRCVTEVGTGACGHCVWRRGRAVGTGGVPSCSFPVLGGGEMVGATGRGAPQLCAPFCGALFPCFGVKVHQSAFLPPPLDQEGGKSLGAGDTTLQFESFLCH